MKLKDFQGRSLRALEKYLWACVNNGGDPAAAFMAETGRPYLPVGGLERVPYVCLRVPTGGGKTLMACHALGTLRDTVLRTDHPLILWLVPSTPILEQTLDRLRDRRDPYRVAAEAAVKTGLQVASVDEALAFTAADLDGGTTVVVGTIQKFRVDAKDGRAVYKSNGSLMPHFSGLSPEERDALEHEGEGADAYLPQSLANVFRRHRPAVVMDEAHKARTSLSFETLARFNPSAILELTATPGMEEASRSRAKDKPLPSNVLHSTSAAELKAEEMVKLPVVLRTHPDWKQTLGDALRLRRDLERVADAEEAAGAPHLRPILLVQAEDKGGDKTLDVVLASLRDDFKLDDLWVAQEAYSVEGTKPEPDADWSDLKDKACPIRVIVTVDKLREGWDCPFAYVLCSLRGSKSGTAVTQLVGRVLRQPQARRREDEQLNRAYVFADTDAFIRTLTDLKEAIVEQGFEKQEAEDLVKAALGQASLQGSLREGEATLVAEPGLERLPAAFRQRLNWVTDTGSTGSADRGPQQAGRLTIRGPVSEEEGSALLAVTDAADRDAMAALVELARDSPDRSAWDPSLASPLRVPAFAVKHPDGEPHLFEASALADRAWSLVNRSALLTDNDFPSVDGAARAGLVDVDFDAHGGHVFTETQGDLLVRQQRALYNEPDWMIADLVLWLDREIDHPDVTLREAQAFLTRVVESLLTERHLRLDRVAARRFKLKRAAERLIASHRTAAQAEAYEATLFGEGLPGDEPLEVDVSGAVEQVMDPDRYLPGEPYKGSHRFRKHAFRKIGDMGNGEEASCAIHLDGMPTVKRWLRNPERSWAGGFSLPLPGGRNFYPDFVAELHDGRWLVVEYKGADRVTNDDSRQKRAIGDLWAKNSGGRCLFIMVSEERWGQIDAAVT